MRGYRSELRRPTKKYLTYYGNEEVRRWEDKLKHSINNGVIWNKMSLLLSYCENMK